MTANTRSIMKCSTVDELILPMDVQPWIAERR